MPRVRSSGPKLSGKGKWDEVLTRGPGSVLESSSPRLTQDITEGVAITSCVLRRLLRHDETDVYTCDGLF